MFVCYKYSYLHRNFLLLSEKPKMLIIYLILCCLIVKIQVVKICIKML